jgi:hypothetical protein
MNRRTLKNIIKDTFSFVINETYSDCDVVVFLKHHWTGYSKDLAWQHKVYFVELLHNVL